MRILTLVADHGIPLDGTKGATVHVLAFRSALEAGGHDVRLLAVNPGRLEDGVRVRRIDVGGAEGLERFRAAQLWLDANREPIAEWGRTDVLYERLGLYPTAAAPLARRLGALHVMEVNAPFARETARHRGLADAGEAEELECAAIRAAGGVVVVSRALAARAATLRGDDAGVLHLPNGVEVERFRSAPELRAAARTRLGVGPGTAVIAFLGTLKPWHGVAVLAEALERALAAGADVHFLAVGDGPEGEALRRRVAAGPLAGRATFAGAVAPAEVPRWLAGADVGVAPYPDLPDFYFSPLKVAEYAAAGLAVVASDLADIADLVPTTAGATFCRPGDAEDLALRLVELARDPVRCRALGEAARRHAEARLDWRRRAVEFEQFASRLRERAEP